MKSRSHNLLLLLSVLFPVVSDVVGVDDLLLSGGGFVGFGDD